MAVLDTGPDQAEARTASRQPWLALGLALLCATSYVVALVLPYYVNGLHHRPAGDSIYLHDMSELWPYDTAYGWLVSLLALFSFVAAPFVGFAVAVWSACRLWVERGAPRRTAVWLAAMVVSTATVLWIFTPLAEELRVWLLD